MKYKTQIVSQGAKYIGHLLQDGVVIFTTPSLDDPIIVSRALATHISNITPPPIPVPFSQQQPDFKRTPIANTISNNYLPAERAPARRSYPPPRKCCGRG